MKDPMLGEVVVSDSELRLRVETSDGEVDFTVLRDGAGVEEVLVTAKFIVSTLEKKLKQAREEIANEMLGLVNGGYLQPGERPLSRRAFLLRTRLEAVDMDADGNTSFHFDDDDMLWGHHILAVCDRDGVRWSVRMWG